MAQIELNQGRGTDAERTLQRALTLHEQAAKSGQTALEARIAHMYTLLQLAGLYQLSNRFNEAAAVAERLLAIAEGLFGPDHPNVATQLEAVAAMYAFQDRFADAEAARKRALAINERAYGNEHPSVAGSLQGLGHLYRLQDRNEEALPLLLRGLSIAEKTLGADDPGLIVYLSEIANLYGGQRRYADAELLLKRALAILDKTSGLDRTVAGVQNVQLMQSLAFLYQSQGRHQEGRPWIDRALAISEQMFGPDHIMTTTMVTSLAMHLLDQDQTDEAERLFERTLPANERSGQDSTAYADNLAGLGMVHFTRKDWGKAYAALERASAIQIAVEKRGAGTGTARRGQQPRVIRQAEMFLLQAVTAFRLTEADPSQADALRDAAFQMAQRAQNSEAGAALGQMAARFSSGTGALATLVRERQDLASEWQAQDARLTAEFSALPAQRKAQKEAALRQRLGAIVGRLDTLDARLAKEFPEYASLASPQPLSISGARSLLAPQEALVFIANRLKQSLVWVITAQEARWELVAPGEADLAREVSALRCGLDATAWELEGKGSCRSLLGISYQAGDPLPFDLVRAHALYDALLAPFQEIIKGKRLLIAASGPLSALPFSVLVTDKPTAQFPADARRYADVAWLAKRHATVVLPSVTSLASLRSTRQAKAAPSAFIGFGNPLLSGSDGQDRRAWAKQTCSKSKERTLPRVAGWRPLEALAKLFRGTLGNADTLRRQSPLPETADELCAVARDLGANERDVVLGSRATETAVKALSDGGRLANYRVLHFATHGLLAGETESFGSGAEPALLLTPPDKATDADDGLLTASEVAKLKLNADWVVLSACNTAGGAKAGAQPLSGLARAFFYAGARALLVSHWYVDSDATVRLVTGIFAQAKLDPAAGRDEAVRRAMLAMIADTSRPLASASAHPSVWAPFVVVGDSGAAR